MYRAQTQDPLHAPRRAPLVSHSSVPHRALIGFANPQAAESLVAGLPAAARVVREAALAGVRECWLEAGPGWAPSRALRREVDRLRGAMHVHFPDDGSTRPGSGRMLFVAGDALPSARQLAGATAAAGPAPLFTAEDAGAAPRLHHAAPDAIRRHYRRAGRAILAATIKPTDGLVSRYLNRPISQAISNLLLRIPPFRPFHATLGTAALAAVMFASLTMFGEGGLLAGALLFQAASMFDGVDGEAARATFRSSDRGALFDSLVDAATNLCFVLGLVVNMVRAGHLAAAGYGLCGLLMLASGLTIIGRRARRSAGPFTFDGVKDRMRARGTRLGQWLIWLTMRDFLALAAVVLVLLGWGEPALAAFSLVMAGWLVVVVATGIRQGATAR